MQYETEYSKGFDTARFKFIPYVRRKQQTGLFWHVHHSVLFEWCYSYDGRKKFIKEHKPKSERRLRLRLLQPIKGELPSEVIKAHENYYKAYEDFYIAWKNYSDNTNEATRVQFDELRKIFYDVSNVLYRIVDDNNSVILALHEQECKNCPWNGKTIFSKTE